MTKSEELCRVFGIVLTRRQVFACRCLERYDLRFGIDFTHKNCEQKAADLWVQHLETADIWRTT